MSRVKKIEGMQATRKYRESKNEKKIGIHIFI
jgi:hypothetical protein